MHRYKIKPAIGLEPILSRLQGGCFHHLAIRAHFQNTRRGNRTPTCRGLNSMPLPLGYTGIKSEHRDLNPDHMAPNHTCYHYTMLCYCLGSVYFFIVVKLLPIKHQHVKTAQNCACQRQMRGRCVNKIPDGWIRTTNAVICKYSVLHNKYRSKEYPLPCLPISPHLVMLYYTTLCPICQEALFSSPTAYR